MAAFSSIKMTFRSNFPQLSRQFPNKAAPVFYESATSSGWISGTGPCNGTSFDEIQALGN